MLLQNHGFHPSLEPIIKVLQEEYRRIVDKKDKQRKQKKILKVNAKYLRKRFTQLLN